MDYLYLTDSFYFLAKTLSDSREPTISLLIREMLAKIGEKLAIKRVCRARWQAAIVVTSIPLTFIGLCGLDGGQDEKAATRIVT